MSIDLSILTADKGYRKIRTSNELELYYAATRVDLLKNGPLMADPLEWWTQRGKARYPTLFKMALEFLSILCTSCQCERVFSGGGRAVTTDRSSLHSATIKALQLEKLA